jgi:hypothetical protein
MLGSLNMSLKQFLLAHVLRKIVKSLPFRLDALLISFFYSTLKYKAQISLFLLAKSRAREVEKTLRGASQVTIVYDNFCSPPTYGDFMYVIFLARFLLSYDVKIKIVILNGDYRDDWNTIRDQGKIRWFITEQERVARFFLGGCAEIVATDWLSFTSGFNSDLEKGVILFKGDVLERKPIYHFCFGILNILLKRKGLKKHLDLTLFHASNALDYLGKQKLLAKNIPDKCIALVCRRNLYWGLERNLSDSDFISLIEKITEKIPSYHIICLSDTVGTNYFRNLAETSLPQFSDTILFSKDFSSSFLGDCLIALKSKGFIQLAGGGITTPVLFSSVPYLVMFDPGPVMQHRAHMLTSWASKKQIFRGVSELDKKLLNRFLTLFQ